MSASAPDEATPSLPLPPPPTKTQDALPSPPPTQTSIAAGQPAEPVAPSLPSPAPPLAPAHDAASSAETTIADAPPPVPTDDALIDSLVTQPPVVLPQSETSQAQSDPESSAALPSAGSLPAPSSSVDSLPTSDSLPPSGPTLPAGLDTLDAPGATASPAQDPGTSSSGVETLDGGESRADAAPTQESIAQSQDPLVPATSGADIAPPTEAPAEAGVTGSASAQPAASASTETIPSSDAAAAAAVQGSEQPSEAPMMPQEAAQGVTAVEHTALAVQPQAESSKEGAVAASEGGDSEMASAPVASSSISGPSTSVPGNAAPAEAATDTANAPTIPEAVAVEVEPPINMGSIDLQPLPSSSDVTAPQQPVAAAQGQEAQPQVSLSEGRPLAPTTSDEVAVAVPACSNSPNTEQPMQAPSVTQAEAAPAIPATTASEGGLSVQQAHTSSEETWVPAPAPPASTQAPAVTSGAAASTSMAVDSSSATSGLPSSTLSLPSSAVLPVSDSSVPPPVAPPPALDPPLKTTAQPLPSETPAASPLGELATPVSSATTTPALASQPQPPPPPPSSTSLPAPADPSAVAAAAPEDSSKASIPGAAEVKAQPAPPQSQAQPLASSATTASSDSATSQTELMPPPPTAPSSSADNASTSIPPVSKPEAPAEAVPSASSTPKPSAQTVKIDRKEEAGPEMPIKDEDKISLVLAANQELIRICVDAQTKEGVPQELVRDVSHRLQTNLAFLASVAERSQRGSPGGASMRPPVAPPRTDVFPHPALAGAIKAIAADSPLPGLYAKMSKAFEGMVRPTAPGFPGGPSQTGTPTAAAGMPAPSGTAGITPPRQLPRASPSADKKHGRDSSASTYEPLRKKTALTNGDVGGRGSASPAPSAAGFGSAIPNGSPGERTSSPSVGRASPGSMAFGQSNPPGSNMPPHPPYPASMNQPPPGMSPQQAQQLIQSFGPNAIATYKVLQIYLRTPACTPAFAAMPLPMQMQQIAALQQSRARMQSQIQQMQQQQQQQNQASQNQSSGGQQFAGGSAQTPQGMMPQLGMQHGRQPSFAGSAAGSPSAAGPNHASPGFAQPNAPSPFPHGGPNGISSDTARSSPAGATSPSPSSMLRQSMSGSGAPNGFGGQGSVARDTPPVVPMQVSNPFAATGSQTGTPTSTTAANGFGGGNGMGMMDGSNPLQSMAQQQQPGMPQGYGLAGNQAQQLQHLLMQQQQGHNQPQGGQHVFSGQIQPPTQQQQQQQQGPSSYAQLQQPSSHQQQPSHMQHQQQGLIVPMGGFGNGTVGNGNGGPGGNAGFTAPGMNLNNINIGQLPAHMQQFFASQQMQAAAGGNVGMGGAVPGSVAWPGGNIQQQQQQTQGGPPAGMMNGAMGAGKGNGNGSFNGFDGSNVGATSINPASLSGGGAGAGINPQQLMSGQQHQQQAQAQAAQQIRGRQPSQTSQAPDLQSQMAQMIWPGGAPGQAQGQGQAGMPNAMVNMPFSGAPGAAGMSAGVGMGMGMGGNMGNMGFGAPDLSGGGGGGDMTAFGMPGGGVGIPGVGGMDMSAFAQGQGGAPGQGAGAGTSS